MENWRNELKELKNNLSSERKIYCDEAEIEKIEQDGLPLPENVKITEEGRYYKIIITDIGETELREVFLHQQTLYLKSIKNGVTLFVVLTIVSLIGFLIFFLRLRNLFS